MVKITLYRSCSEVMFNSQERTLREIVELAVSAGWKVVKVTRDLGSLFGYTIAVPVLILVQDEGSVNNTSGKTHIAILANSECSPSVLF
jgi:hypothetical protein